MAKSCSIAISLVLELSSPSVSFQLTVLLRVSCGSGRLILRMPRDSSSMLALVGILVAVLVFIGTPAVSAVHLGYQNGSPVIGENNVNSMTIGVSNQSSSSPIYWRRPGCYRVGE